MMNQVSSCGNSQKYAQNNLAIEFLESWKRSVRLIGMEYFGDGTEEGFEMAECIYDLRPNIPLINQKIFSLDIEDRKFMIFFVNMNRPRNSGDKLSQERNSNEDQETQLLTGGQRTGNSNVFRVQTRASIAMVSPCIHSQQDRL